MRVFVCVDKKIGFLSYLILSYLGEGVIDIKEKLGFY